jgi:molybdopterin-binding protein
MKISGRNKLQATVKEIVKSGVKASVVMDYQGEELIAAITVDTADDLDLRIGDKVTALVKATEVMVLKLSIEPRASHAIRNIE